MSKIRRTRLAWILAGSALILGGCENQDAEHLTRLGTKLGDKARALGGGADGKLAAGWQAFRADLDEMALDTRVSARLRWDKALDGCTIQVHVKDGVVELNGKVRDASQRKRAVELAESTTGAEKVTDTLEVTAPTAGSEP